MNDNHLRRSLKHCLHLIRTPLLVAAGCDVEEFEDFLYEDGPGGGGYNSNVCFGRILYRKKETRNNKDGNNDNDNNNNGSERTITAMTESLMIKTVFSNCNQQHLSSDLTFFNEMSVYVKILPFLITECSKTEQQRFDVENLFAKFYYGSIVQTAYGLEENLIILENLGVSGYRKSKSKFFLDYAHLRLAVEALGRLHALSYNAKKFDNSKFSLLTGGSVRLHETRFEFQNTLPGYLEKCADRCLAVWMKKNNNNELAAIARLYSIIKRLDDYLHSIYHRLKSPDDIAVFCHGDFVWNNMLFRYYDADSAEPTGIKVFDFGNARYCSPAVDLCNLLYLSCDQTTRNLHWNDLIGCYYDTLVESSSSSMVPDLQRIVDSFKDYAPHIYFIACYYVLTYVAGTEGIGYDERISDPLERELREIYAASDEAVHTTNEVLDDMIRRGFIV